jgi:hypothetical protein
VLGFGGGGQFMNPFPFNATLHGITRGRPEIRSGASDREITIGQTMPYSGSASAFIAALLVSAGRVPRTLFPFDAVWPVLSR